MVPAFFAMSKTVMTSLATRSEPTKIQKECVSMSQESNEINMIRKCYVVSNDKKIPAKFYGVFQVAMVVSENPLISGRSTGQVMEPVAVVEYDGKLHKVYLDQVHFDDTTKTTEHANDSTDWIAQASDFIKDDVVNHTNSQDPTMKAQGPIFTAADNVHQTLNDKLGDAKNEPTD